MTGSSSPSAVPEYWNRSAASPGGFGPTAAAFGVIRPFDGKPATVGNGVMVSLAMTTPAKVDTLYRLALSLGATDEGAPGERGDRIYAAYFRDLDGNKLMIFFMK
jgi:hypothetical protein